MSTAVQIKLKNKYTRHQFVKKIVRVSSSGSKRQGSERIRNCPRMEYDPKAGRGHGGCQKVKHHVK